MQSSTSDARRRAEQKVLDVFLTALQRAQYDVEQLKRTTPPVAQKRERPNLKCLSKDELRLFRALLAKIRRHDVYEWVGTRPAYPRLTFDPPSDSYQPAPVQLIRLEWLPREAGDRAPLSEGQEDERT